MILAFTFQCSPRNVQFAGSWNQQNQSTNNARLIAIIGNVEEAVRNELAYPKVFLHNDLPQENFNYTG